MDERFEILGELGRGGMATVFLAVDRQTKRQVALKVVHKHLADRPSAGRRLSRELEAARRIQHRAVLHPLEEVVWEGSPALVLPAMSGQTLSDRVERDGPLPEADLRLLLERIGGALATAHAAGVLHRDVTPRNVLWDDASAEDLATGAPAVPSEPMLADFGLARLADQGTASTSALGTVGFAAPETYVDGARDPRSDAYGLGAVLYLAATGKPPFEAATAMGALEQQLDGRFVPLAKRRPDLSADLVGTVEALLRPDPADRPSVCDALRTLQRPSRSGARSTSALQVARVGTAISMLLVVGLGFFQDLGAFALSTLIQGHAVPSGDIHEMTQGVSGILLLPLALLPAVGVLLRKDGEQLGVLRSGLAVLSLAAMAYVFFAGVLAPQMGMGSGMDLVGTMLFHLMAWVPLVAVVLAVTRPWSGWRAEVAIPEAPAVPLVDEATHALDALLKASASAPEIVQSDLRGLVAELRTGVRELASELAAVDAGLTAAQPDPSILAGLETRRARALARGEPTAELDRALEAQRRLQAEADALEERRVRAVARLLEIRAEAAHARRTLVDREDELTVTRDLTALRDRARAAAQARAEVASYSK